MNILVFGGSGELGSEFVRVASRDHTVFSPAHHEIPVQDAFARSAGGVDGSPFHVVVNCAAVRDLVRCEGDPETAWSVNAVGARQVARLARDIGARHVYISTDYVFGHAQGGCDENAQPNPLQVYGMTKWAGEQFVLDEGGYVVRTSALFGTHRYRNFVEKMLMAEDPEVVDDQQTGPTSCVDLSVAILDLLSAVPRAEPGIYHITNAVRFTWYEYARMIRVMAGLKPPRVRMTQFDERPRRPQGTWLIGTRFNDELRFPPLRNLQFPLDEYLAARTAENVDVA